MPSLTVIMNAEVTAILDAGEGTVFVEGQPKADVEKYFKNKFGADDFHIRKIKCFPTDWPKGDYE